MYPQGHHPDSSAITCDVLVIGGGIAALVAALEARRSGADVLMVCKKKVGRSGNVIVSGGGFSVSASVDPAPDSPEQHLRDTIEGGDGINDPALVRVFATEATERVLALERHGVRFLRLDGRPALRRTLGHSKPRSLPIEPAGYPHSIRGLAITLPLLKAAEASGVRTLSDTPVHRLLVRDGVVGGALAADSRSGRELVLRSRSVVLAGGGGGCLFAGTNNTSDMTGDSFALALEAGAALRDMEFVQYFPTMVARPARIVLSNGLLSAGGVLRNRHGDRFMPRYDPANAESTTRDVMSRAIFQEVQSGNGVEGGVYIDLSGVPPATMERYFRPTAHLLRDHGVDLSTDWLVVSPVTHFFMGGAWIDERCRTGVEGLFAAGEATGGIHGANRLGGNALSEATVFGGIAGREAAAHARRAPRLPDPPRLEGAGLPPGGRGPGLAELKAEIRRTMWDHSSIVRSGPGLRRALARLQECRDGLPHCSFDPRSQGAAYRELRRMVLAATAIVTAALERRESRGAHYRTDFPERDDALWLASSRTVLRDGRLETTFVPHATTRPQTYGVFETP